MAAKRHVNPDQLKMFMTADEIKSTYQAGDWNSNAHDEADEYGYRHKVMMAQDRGLYQAIEREGVKNPVHVSLDARQEVLEGHHRIAAQGDIDPDRLLPVMHWESRNAAIDAVHNEGRRVPGLGDSHYDEY